MTVEHRAEVKQWREPIRTPRGRVKGYRVVFAATCSCGQPICAFADFATARRRWREHVAASVLRGAIRR